MMTGFRFVAACAVVGIKAIPMHKLGHAEPTDFDDDATASCPSSNMPEKENAVWLAEMFDRIAHGNGKSQPVDDTLLEEQVHFPPKTLATKKNPKDTKTVPKDFSSVKSVFENRFPNFKKFVIEQVDFPEVERNEYAVEMQRAFTWETEEDSYPPHLRDDRPLPSGQDFSSLDIFIGSLTKSFSRTLEIARGRNGISFPTKKNRMTLLSDYPKITPDEYKEAPDQVTDENVKIDFPEFWYEDEVFGKNRFNGVQPNIIGRANEKKGNDSDQYSIDKLIHGSSDPTTDLANLKTKLGEAIKYQRNVLNYIPSKEDVEGGGKVEGEEGKEARADEKLFDRHLKEGYIYIVNYEIVGATEDKLKNMKSKDRTIWMPAPIAVFVAIKAEIMPILIMPDRDAEGKKIVYTNLCTLCFPQDQDPKAANEEQKKSQIWMWRYAKTVVQNADMKLHEIGSHVTGAHFISEVFFVAMFRHLHFSHPVYTLLLDHVHKTLGINRGARDTLIPGNIKNVDVPLEYSAATLKKYWKAYNWKEKQLPKDLSARGFTVSETEPTDADKVPQFNMDADKSKVYYMYGREGLSYYNIIRSMVHKVLKEFYGTDEKVRTDKQIQNWDNELQDKCGPTKVWEIKDLGTHETIIDLGATVTHLIWTASAYHSAINFLQNIYMSFIPFQPFALYHPLENGEEFPANWNEEELVKRILNDKLKVADQASTVKTLTRWEVAPYPILTWLGWEAQEFLQFYLQETVNDKVAARRLGFTRLFGHSKEVWNESWSRHAFSLFKYLEAVDEARKKLKDLSRITQRDEEMRRVPYFVMDPKFMTASIEH